MANHQRLDVRTVAIVGAGVSGVSAAVYLRRQGLDVTVYERSNHAGGIWVYDSRTAKDDPYPSTIPSVGDSPDDLKGHCSLPVRYDTPVEGEDHVGPVEIEAGAREIEHDIEDILVKFAPPGPCYVGLKNNVSTTEMQMQCHAFRPNTADFVPHHVLGDYIRDAAKANGIFDVIQLNTRVKHIQKSRKKWSFHTAELHKHPSGVSISESIQEFDAVIVASGHYHACNIPDIPGLASWKQAFPDKVEHSKLYRQPESFRDQNVLLIGAGVSSTDIARELGDTARVVFQSSRGGMFDLPSHLLPDNAARIGPIQSFDALASSAPNPNGAFPATVTLGSGEKLCDIHRIIVCTGYHVSKPFLRQYHADGVRAEDADETVLVTDGRQTHNLHKDIWYIPDPTLAFVGVPYHTATFSFFEFQSMALAAVFAGKVALPSEQEMRNEYNERLRQKGASRTFHSLKTPGAETAYVASLINWVNAELPAESRLIGHSQRFLAAYARRWDRMEALKAGVRDSAIDEQVMRQMIGCS